MRTQLQITTFSVFMAAILEDIMEYEAATASQQQTLSVKDAKAIESIKHHFKTGGIANGEILRDDLKIILRGVYGVIGRFFYTFARRMEAIRNHPEFTRAALRRGDWKKTQVIDLFNRLEEERKAKQDLREELKIVMKKQSEADLEIDQLIQENTQLKTDKEKIIQENENKLKRIRNYMNSIGVAVPDWMSSTVDTPRCVSDSKLIQKSSKLGLTIFPILPDTVPDSEPSTPMSTTSQTSIRSLSSGDPFAITLPH